jgi:hypothetical protein
MSTFLLRGDMSTFLLGVTCQLFFWGVIRQLFFSTVNYSEELLSRLQASF